VRPLRTQAIAGGDREATPGMSDAAVDDAVQRACVPALGPEERMRFSAPSLRAGFAAYASQPGASDPAIVHQTRH